MKARPWTAVIATALFLLNASAVFAQGASASIIPAVGSENHYTWI